MEVILLVILKDWKFFEIDSITELYAFGGDTHSPNLVTWELAATSNRVQ